MERVLQLFRVKSLLFLITCLLAAAHSALATTAIVPTDDALIVEARAIVRGKVVSVESAMDGQNRIFTYITLKVQEVLKGQITERRIVIKEPGGEVGNRGSFVFGTPTFARGDKVLLYLDTWQDGSLRVHQMFLGRFSIVQDAQTGELQVTRNIPEAGVSILSQSPEGPITNRSELSKYAEMVRTRLAANLERSREFEAQVYGNIPLHVRPAEYSASKDAGDISPQFHLWSPPIRWFQPDTGQPVVFKTNPNGAPNPQSVNDAVAAMNAWSTVPGCSLVVSNGGTTAGCGLFQIDGENTISFNNCDGYFSGTGNCSSGILAVASIASYDPSQTRVVNGVTFAKALESNITFNPFSACNFSDHCNVQEITTHEMGHALGLHHSWQPSFGGTPTANEQAATMFWIAHFDGRCASLRTDDISGITFIYPSSGGGGGPLSVVTSSLPGGTVGTGYTQTLSATGGTLPYTWSLVAGQGTLPPGLSLSASGVISGTPTTAGTSNFTVKVTDNPGATAQRALSIVVTAGGGGGPLNSQFVSQNVPTSVNPGAAFLVNMKFLNTGTTTWSGTAYFFASQNPTLNQTWGGNGVSLYGFSAAPGEIMDVNFNATAPTTPGTYNFQWQMYQNGGVGFFGQMSTNVVIQVGSAGTDNAAFVSQSVPQNMSASQTSTVLVTMRNTGTTTWTAGNYYLGSQNPQGNSTWGLNRVNLATSVAPSAQVTFSFNITAPAAQGTYNFQWQVAKDGLGDFGALSSNAAISVYSNTSDTDADCIPDAVELSESTNPLVKDNDIFNNARLFAMQQYRDYLGREGESSGIAYWTNQITSGQQTRAQVIDSFFNSPEFQAVTPIARLYFAYFLRIPDYGGLLYWVNQSRSGMSLDTISESFAQSPEFITRYGSLNNGEFVTLVYQNVLGRAPDPEGFAYWTGLLNSGAYTRGQVMLGFSESPEFRTSSFNKVYVTQMYVGMLRRSPEQEGFDYWVRQMELGQSGLNLINGFLVAPEYRSRFLP